MAVPHTNIPVLIYDGECPMCLRARDWVARRSDPATLRLLPCQSPERPAVAPQIPTEACMESMQLVLPDGTVHAGERAFEHIFPYIRGWAWAGLLFRLPGAGIAAPIVYRWVARHRLQISAFLTPKAPGSQCSVDKGCD
ncbi:MAG: DUF393 domain-containing protein [Candidatus Hydrogenedentes bacterium]|nr:DUF393 domain-containing protein [Candidatus Hydrogenedentota bacterium]